MGVLLCSPLQTEPCPHLGIWEPGVGAGLCCLLFEHKWKTCLSFTASCPPHPWLRGNAFLLQPGGKVERVPFPLL